MRHACLLNWLLLITTRYFRQESGACQAIANPAFLRASRATFFALPWVTCSQIGCMYVSIFDACRSSLECSRYRSGPPLSSLGCQAGIPFRLRKRNHPQFRLGMVIFGPISQSWAAVILDYLPVQHSYYLSQIVNWRALRFFVDFWLTIIVVRITR